MKLLHKAIPMFSIGALITTPILSTTSCSCVFELHLTQQEQYIYDRTFSIMGKGTTEYVFGTAWIISDATKDNLNDYSYWMATNWHVLHSMEKIKANQYYYADNSFTFGSQYVDYRNYLPFVSFQKEDINKFIYTSFISETYKGAIDLGVVKVNFGTPTGDLKKKLDNINSFQKQNGYINKFAKDSSEVRSKNKIIGGYPMKKETSSAFGGQWESHSFKGDNMKYYQSGTSFDGTNVGHAIGNPYLDQHLNIREGGTEDYPYWDISPQYKFETSVEKDFMSGGASGSMMITEDYEVCGIYWGGWEENDKYYPAFSLFNTGSKNFLQPYI